MLQLSRMCADCQTTLSHPIRRFPTAGLPQDKCGPLELSMRQACAYLQLKVGLNGESTPPSLL